MSPLESITLASKVTAAWCCSFIRNPVQNVSNQWHPLENQRWLENLVPFHSKMCDRNRHLWSELLVDHGPGWKQKQRPWAKLRPGHGDGENLVISGDHGDLVSNNPFGISEKPTIWDRVLHQQICCKWQLNKRCFFGCSTKKLEIYW